MQQSSPSAFSRRDALLVVCIWLAWAGNFVTSKLAVREVPPFLFTALRLGLLGLVLAPFVRRPPSGTWPRLVAMALCTSVLHFGLTFWSLRLSHTVASPAIVMQSYVPMTTLLAWWLLGERLTWQTGVAIAVSFTGVLVLGFDPVVLRTPAAVLLMLAGAFFLACGSVLLRRLRGLDMVSQQGWSALIGVLPLVGLSAAFEPGGLDDLAAASWVAWAGVVYAALIASLVGHGLYYVLLQRHPVAQVTPFLLLTPLLATLLGIVFMGDDVGPRLWLGGAMVLGGVMGIARRNLANVTASAEGDSRAADASG